VAAASITITDVTAATTVANAWDCAYFAQKIPIAQRTFAITSVLRPSAGAGGSSQSAAGSSSGSGAGAGFKVSGQSENRAIDLAQIAGQPTVAKLGAAIKAACAQMKKSIIPGRFFVQPFAGHT
jgi:hypothetical protein